MQMNGKNFEDLANKINHIDVKLASIDAKLSVMVTSQTDHETRLREIESRTTRNTQTLKSLMKWVGVIGTATIVGAISVILGVLERLISIK